MEWNDGCETARSEEKYSEVQVGAAVSTIEGLWLQFCVLT